MNMWGISKCKICIESLLIYHSYHRLALNHQLTLWLIYSLHCLSWKVFVWSQVGGTPHLRVRLLGAWRAVTQLTSLANFMLNSLWPCDVIWRHRSESPLAQVMVCCLMVSGHYLNQCWLITKGVLWHSTQCNFTRNVYKLNSLWQSDAIWQHRFRSTLAQVMACCLTAPSHYLNQCWLIISEVQWHSY